MSHKTLVQQIDNLEFSDEATEMFLSLTQFDASDEGAAVVLIAAALLLGRQHVDSTPFETDQLIELCDEFADLVFVARDRLLAGRCRPSLRVVGGTDHPLNSLERTEK